MCHDQRKHRQPPFTFMGVFPENCHGENCNLQTSITFMGFFNVVTAKIITVISPLRHQTVKRRKELPSTAHQEV